MDGFGPRPVAHVVGSSQLFDQLVTLGKTIRPEVFLNLVQLVRRDVLLPDDHLCLLLRGHSLLSLTNRYVNLIAALVPSRAIWLDCPDHQVLSSLLNLGRGGLLASIDLLGSPGVHLVQNPLLLFP